MNKLINILINKENSTMLFGLELADTIQLSDFTIYMDECQNVENVYSDESIKHDYVFTHNDCNITKVTDKWYTIVVNDAVFSEMSDHLKYVRLTNEQLNVEGMYYNPSSIYTAELTHIKKVCSTCLDDACMQLIAYVTFKKQLLEDAINTNKTKDAMQLYMEISKLLKLDIPCPTTGCANGCCCLK